KSAKDFFFPQSENLVKFKTSGKNIEIIPEKIEEKQAVYFGIKGCDVKSFDILDLVFLADPVDIYYQAKRMGSIIISMSCNTPEETCFCTSFGIDPANPKGDATCHIVNDYLFINANTAKGKEFLNFIESVCEKCDDTDEKTVENKKEEINKIVEVLPLKSLDLTSFNEENLNEKFDSLKWEDLSKACIGCGTCTFICPTCQCYDMKDFNTGNGIQRYRCWDSCMYSDFTRMAHGNP
ncbi:MAG: 4Fe-4S dicluster domain-containing protein, partial [Oscillospiraceae bacterium]